MQNHTEQIQALEQKFDQIDTDKDGYITMEQLKQFLQKDNVFNAITITNFINQQPKHNINKNDFVCYLIESANEGKMHFSFKAWYLKNYLKEKSKKYAGAAPIELRKIENFINIFTKNIECKDKMSNITFEIGIDQEKQSKKIQVLSTLLKRNVQGTFLLFKFQLLERRKQFTQFCHQAVTGLLEIIKGQDENIKMLLNLIKISFKYDNKYVYLIIQVMSPLIQKGLNYLHQLLLLISPHFDLQFKVELQAHLKNLLQVNYKIENANYNLKFELATDSMTKNEMKSFYATQKLQSLAKQDNRFQVIAPYALLFLLDHFQATFAFENVGDAFQQLMGFSLSDSISIDTLKQFLQQAQVRQNLQSIIPNFTQMFQILQSYGVAKGQLTINLKDIFLGFQFDIEVNNFLKLF